MQVWTFTQRTCRAASILCLLGLLLGSGLVVSHQGEPISISAKSERIELGPSASYFEDTSSAITPIQAWRLYRDNRFKQPKSPSLQFGYSSSAQWIAIPLRNLENNPLGKLLEVRYAPLDEIQVYLQSKRTENPRLIGELGDRLPYDQRPISARYYILPFEVPNTQRSTLIIRVRTQSSLTVPLFLSDPVSIYERDHDVQLGQGIFYGVSIALVLYNLFLFLSTRKFIYFPYIVYVLGYTLFMASLDGYLYQLWPN